MNNNAFFNIVFFNKNTLNYDSDTLVMSIDSTNYNEFYHHSLDTEMMVDELRIIDTLTTGIGASLPDVQWEKEFIVARTQNYYSALLSVVCSALKNGVLKRANLFYPFLRSSYTKPIKHGSTIMTFLTELVFPDNTSLFIITEEIPDNYSSTIDSFKAYSFAERTLFNVRNASWVYTKYKYLYYDDINRDTHVYVNYILSYLLEINFHINIEEKEAKVISSSNNCRIINKQTYNNPNRLKLKEEDNIVFLPCDKGKSFDEFAYQSYVKTFQFILESYLEDRILKYSSLLNCVSLPVRIFLERSCKYIGTLLKKLHLPIPSEIKGIIERYTRESKSRLYHEIASIGGTATGAVISMNIDKK